MKLIEVNNEKLLNDFLIKKNYSEFLQSWEWGEFQKIIYKNFFRFVLVDDNEKVLAAISFSKKIIFKKLFYFYCPRGPIFSDSLNNEEIKKVANFLFLEIKKIAKKENCFFIRIEPENNFIIDSLANNFLIKKTIDLQPKKSLILDLSKNEDELLKEMHQKTRYNLRLALKKNIEIIDNGQEFFDDFFNIMMETGNRDGFNIHDKRYYKEMVCFNNNFCRLVLAKYNKKIISGLILVFFGNMATYVHGGSSNNFRNLMPNYLLQWQAIKLAKSKGIKYYDFYGIDEDKWPGVTKFKKGFSGSEINYAGTYDLIFNNIYYSLYLFLRLFFRKLKRIWKKF